MPVGPEDLPPAPSCPSAGPVPPGVQQQCHCHVRWYVLCRISFLSSLFFDWLLGPLSYFALFVLTQRLERIKKDIFFITNSFLFFFHTLVPGTC